MKQMESEDSVIMLDLSDQKANNIFVADQTPTPTRLIRNCEEVGLFEDLQHVNPFDETFRRAFEQKSGQTPIKHPLVNEKTEEESLHTPQVFPQIESSTNVVEIIQKSLESPVSASAALDVPVVQENLASVNLQKMSNRQNSSTSSQSSVIHEKKPKYRAITEKAQLSSQMPTTIQLIPSQVLTVLETFPSTEMMTSKEISATTTAIPIQKVKPFILPKPTASSRQTSASTPNTPTIHSNEPSSASLTPTSQLPIKERLKIILSNNCSKTQIVELPKMPIVGDAMERKRAAASRYRDKMRNEHKELRRKNAELHLENDKLRDRVKQLENLVTRMQCATSVSHLGNGSVRSTQIEIPPSTIQLVMSIPKVLIPTSGQPILQNPITYRLEQKKN